MAALSLSRPAQDLVFLCERLATETAGARHALVFSSDGLLMTASMGLEPADAERLAATGSSVLSIALGTSAFLHLGAYRESILHYDGGSAIFMVVSELAGLAVLTDPDAKIGNVRYELSLFIQRVGALVTPEVRAELRGVLRP